MRTRNTIILLLLLVTGISVAQGGKLLREKKEQIKSLKTAFITNELNLTPEESAKFWPLYNAFEEKQQEIRKQRLKGYLNRMDNDDFDNLPEKEAGVILTQMISSEEEIHQAKKKFILSLKEFLPAVKILKLKKAEEDFNRKLLQQYRDRRARR